MHSRQNIQCTKRVEAKIQFDYGNRSMHDFGVVTIYSKKGWLHAQLFSVRPSWLH